MSRTPAAEELVLFNRSWYNRAGVERVMNFCTDAEYESFLIEVVPFEHMLIGSGIQIMKYYLGISKKEQKKRLEDRQNDPLKRWKNSPIDAVAVKHWARYTEARDVMFCANFNPAVAMDRRSRRRQTCRASQRHSRFDYSFGMSGD